ncbi:hypothetical protein EDC56_0605 [Sinobacterium caligoides]|uniref:Transposase IS200-like domain-containing protein n=1 Tax=Sinobacterium caligoides TaxID=933926 RepID=A0A3N2DZK8_9GAMM|nr:transposase [Sinobacterium caligoides]ROS05082.1 hypothetical protein EDC56_0605 [Sinobacterium caligoides]
MTSPRSRQISLDATPYYHCVSRCVRRAFLCGDEYEHRRGWVESRLFRLAEVFCLDIAAYAVMSNHYHVVLHINSAEAAALDTEAVIARWHQLFKGHALSQRYCAGEPLVPAEREALDTIVALWRKRLTDISWFMRIINEGIARQANQEDQCTGRFWEGRFKSQALLDEKALLACMAYVDLNPVRAKMAKTPESSAFTSVRKRALRAKQVSPKQSINHPRQQVKGLLRFAGNPREPMPVGIPCRLSDYLQLVDVTGRCIRHNKRGAIAEELSPILSRLAIAPDDWLANTQHFERRYTRIATMLQKLRAAGEGFCRPCDGSEFASRLIKANG